LQAEAKQALPTATLVIELGRYLVGEAGIYVCRVIDRKVSRGQVFLVTDGGLHHHLAASGNFGQVLRKNYPVAIGNRVRDGVHEKVSVVGPLCTPLDLLADRVVLPRADEGDLVVVFQSGAYGRSASPLGFLCHLEQLLKACYVQTVDTTVPRIHDLYKLADRCGLEMTEEQKDALQYVNLFNIEARYEEYKREFHRKCTKSFAAKSIATIEELRSWLLKKTNS
jgi:hypothetical protein